MKKVIIYTDGACLGNPGAGGWAASLNYSGIKKLFVGSSPETTNNRMELSAVIEALAQLKEPCEVDLYSDSQYVVKAINESWLVNWQNNNWKDSRKKPVKNQDLWESLVPLLVKHKVRFNWVRGHDGDEGNEIVDKAAQKAAREQLSGELKST